VTDSNNQGERPKLSLDQVKTAKFGANQLRVPSRNDRDEVDRVGERDGVMLRNSAQDFGYYGFDI
jgi:hypothetical protein